MTLHQNEQQASARLRGERDGRYGLTPAEPRGTGAYAIAYWHAYDLAAAKRQRGAA